MGSSTESLGSSDIGARRRAVIASVLVQAGFVLACGAPGERAAMVRGDAAAPCLPGETCSSLAPRGLSFRSPSGGLFGGAPATTAVGGTQGISVYTLDGAPIAATNLIATVDRLEASATMRRPDSEHDSRWFEFAPNAAGSFVVSVRESPSRALLDRITLRSAVPTSAELLTTGLIDIQPIGAIWSGADVPVRAWAYLGEPGPDSARVVDDRLSLVPADPSALAVNGLSIRGLRDGRAGVGVRLGVTTLSTSVEVVSSVDALRVVRSQRAGAAPSPWNLRAGIFRVEALRGGRVVIGAPITVEPMYPELQTQADVRELAAGLYGPGFYLLVRDEVTRAAQLPITFRCGNVELSGDIVIEPSS